MPRPLKSDGSTYHSDTIPMGVHLVSVKSVRYKRNKVQQVATYEDGMPTGYDIRLQNALHQSKILSLSYHPKALFVMENFLKALGVDMTSKTDSATLIDKKLYIVVQKQLFVDPTGQPVMENGMQKTALGISASFYPADKKPILPESEFTINRREI